MKVRLWASDLEMKSTEANVGLLDFAFWQQMPLPLFSQWISHDTSKQSIIWGDDDFFSSECILKSSPQPMRHQKSISLRGLSDSPVTSIVPPPHRSYSSTFRRHTKCMAGSGICTHCFHVSQILSPISVWLPYSKQLSAQMSPSLRGFPEQLLHSTLLLSTHQPASSLLLVLGISCQVHISLSYVSENQNLNSIMVETIFDSLSFVSLDSTWLIRNF